MVVVEWIALVRATEGGCYIFRSEIFETSNSLIRSDAFAGWSTSLVHGHLDTGAMDESIWGACEGYVQARLLLSSLASGRVVSPVQVSL